MLPPSMIMPVKITRWKLSRLLRQVKWTGSLAHHFVALEHDQSARWKSRWGDHPMSTETSGHTRLKGGEDHTIGNTTTPGNYGRPLWPQTFYWMMKAATIGLTLILLCSSARLSGTSGLRRDQKLPSPKHPAVELVPSKYPKWSLFSLEFPMHWTFKKRLGGSSPASTTAIQCGKVNQSTQTSFKKLSLSLSAMLRRSLPNLPQKYSKIVTICQLDSFEKFIIQSICHRDFQFHLS